MVAYRTDEMVGITELSKSLGKYLDIVTSSAFNKLAIVRRNKAEAVIVPIKEYEQMKEAYDRMEDMEIAQMLEERVFSRSEPVKYTSLDDMLDELRKEGRNV